MNYTLGKEYIYEWHGFGFPYPKNFPAHKVVLKDNPKKDITVYKGELGWILLAPEGKFYDTNGKRPIGFPDTKEAVKHYLSELK